MKLFKGKSGTLQPSNDQDKNIIVLGACCNKSSETFKNVKEAVTCLGLEQEVANIGDFEIIASYGVMTTPALVINKKVYSQGKKLSVEDAKKLIEKALKG